MPYYRAEKIYYEEMDDRRSHGRDMLYSPHHHRHSYHPEDERYRRDGYPEYYSGYDDGHRRSSHSHHYRPHSSRQEITPSPRSRELMPVPNHYPDENRYEKPQQMISLKEAKDLVVTAVKELNATPTAPKPQRVVREEDYQLLQQRVNDFVSPDMSHYDEQIAVLRSEISTVLEEVSLVNDVASNLSKNINDDIKDLKQDIRAIDKVVNDVEDRVKDTERELSQDLKVIEQELEDKIQKILANPLAGVK